MTKYLIQNIFLCQKTKIMAQNILRLKHSWCTLSLFLSGFVCKRKKSIFIAHLNIIFIV